MTHPADIPALIARHAHAVEAFLRDELPRRVALADAPEKLAEAIRYSLLAGGKRLRPALLLETWHACSASRVAVGNAILGSAAAVELIHTFSLVHDDLPAMDDDDLRRGVPTNHKVFGEAMAILAGDAMTTLAFEVLGRTAPADLVAPLVIELARSAGPVGMIGGQVLDMQSQGAALPVEALSQVHRLKTGALVTAACRMGAILARAGDAQLDAVTRFGAHLGLAFQIADDLLDVTASAEAVGKATGKDAAAGKNTYPALLGVEEARQAARGQSEAAIEALAGFGAGAEGLRGLARYTVERVR